jgi:hypothetical protein
MAKTRPVVWNRSCAPQPGNCYLAHSVRDFSDAWDTPRFCAGFGLPLRAGGTGNLMRGKMTLGILRNAWGWKNHLLRGRVCDRRQGWLRCGGDVLVTRAQCSRPPMQACSLHMLTVQNICYDLSTACMFPTGLVANMQPLTEPDWRSTATCQSNSTSQHRT